MAVQIEGLRDAVAAFRAVPDAIREAVGEKVVTAAAIIESEARKRVPVDSGDLDRSLRTVISKRKQAAVVGSDLLYAKWVELGTLRTSAQPYLYPAFRWGARYLRKELRGMGGEIGAKVRGKTRRSKARPA